MLRCIRNAGIPAWAIAALGWAILSGAPTPSPAGMMVARDFAPIVEQGFGDRYNSFPWSMKWWNGRLYVGTLRSMYCVQQATIARWYPDFDFLYPPADPNFACTDDPSDLPLQAEIWRWTPETGVWDLLLTSPKDVPVPGDPTRTVARDIGFRTMTVYEEADGTEALYVGAFCAESFLAGVNPPRLLRSTDGDTFEPVPQDPGTFLASISTDGYPFNGFRSLEVYDGRIFVVASAGFLGHGKLIESADPSAGNDAWHYAAPPDQVFYQLASYNGYLYAGQADENGFFLVKTDAKGAPPYDFEVVIPRGGYLTKPKPSDAIVSLFEFNGRLYVGTNIPGEIYRVNPDDSWDLIAGDPRQGPSGLIAPLSGIGPGFDNSKTLHIWRMQDAYGVLYTGTMDQTTKWSVSPFSSKSLNSVAGFDMYGTENGYYYTMITRHGLLTKWDEGLRQFAFSPEYGLIAGGVNNRFGCNIWQGFPDESRPPAPRQLEAEVVGGSSVILGWERVPGASRYHVYRARLTGSNLGYAYLGSTQVRAFADSFNVSSSNPVHYYVIAETTSGRRSGPSNIARVPFLGEPATFLSVYSHFIQWNASPEVMSDLIAAFRVYFGQRNHGQAVKRLSSLQRKVEADPSSMNPSWRSEDAGVILAKLARRILYVQAGVHPWWAVVF